MSRYILPKRRCQIRNPLLDYASAGTHYRAPWGWRTAIAAVVCVAACVLIGALMAQGV